MRRIPGVLAAATIAAALSLGAPGPAMAQAETCDQMVVDNSKRKLLAGHPEIQAQAEQLARRDVRVRIRVEEGLTTSTDAFQAQLTAECASWRDDGEPHPKLLFIIISLGIGGNPNRGHGHIYPGEDLQGRGLTHDTAQEVWNDHMAPKVSAYRAEQPTTHGSIAAGIAAGELELQSQLDEPYDWTWLWWTLGIVAGLVVLGLLIWGVVVLARGSGGRGGSGSHTTTFIPFFGGGDGGVRHHHGGGGDFGGGSTTN